MNLLAIDTSSNWLKVALDADGEVRSTIVRSRNRYSDFLMTEIDHILKSAGITVRDLNLVGCITGPGHFTGIRSGLATIKAISFAQSVPVIGLPYAECFHAKEPIVLLRKARKGWMYVSEYDGKSWTYSMNSLDTISKLLSGKKAISEEEIKTANVEINNGPLFTGFDMIKAMEEAFKNKIHIYDHLSVKPFYVQRPIAEENLMKKKRGSISI